MLSRYGKTESLWLKEEEVPRFSRLESNIQCEVCIVGGGIAGLMTAYLLCREGRDVVVLEAGNICGGETGRTTAHLSFALDDRFYELERLFGRRGAALAFQSHARAVDLIEEITISESLECEFARLDGYLFVPPLASKDELKREYQSARRAGLSVEQVDRAPLGSIEPGPCLRFPNQGQFNPLKFLGGLAGAIGRLGGKSTPIRGSTTFPEARGVLRKHFAATT
jgi:glycine/D-amino acid oxidase-like deaminating enzyme